MSLSAGTRNRRDEYASALRSFFRKLAVQIGGEPVVDFVVNGHS